MVIRWWLATFIAVAFGGVLRGGQNDASAGCSVAGTYNGVKFLQEGTMFAGVYANGQPCCAGTLQWDCSGVMNILKAGTFAFQYAQSPGSFHFKSGVVWAQTILEEPTASPTPASASPSTSDLVESASVVPPIDAAVVTLFETHAGNRFNKCAESGASCNPLMNSCCQGPTLMSCRFRAFPSGLRGMAFTCGPENSDEKAKDHTCLIEGSTCNPQENTCCQVDSAKPMTCQMKTHSGESDGSSYVCGRAWDIARTCVPHGQACDPFDNSCCQNMTQLSNLLTCQRGNDTPSVNRLGSHYSCINEFS